MYSTANNSNGNGNGYHHYQQPSGDMQLGTVHRNRARRGSRAGSTSRYRDGHGTAVVGSRVSEHDPLQKQPLQRPPCTDFDMAYFSSYAHVGIHEEMIKVFSLPLFSLQSERLWKKVNFYCIVLSFVVSVLNWQKTRNKFVEWVLLGLLTIIGFSFFLPLVFISCVLSDFVHKQPRMRIWCVKLFKTIVKWVLLGLVTIIEFLNLPLVFISYFMSEFVHKQPRIRICFIKSLKKIVEWVLLGLVTIIEFLNIHWSL